MYFKGSKNKQREKKKKVRVKRKEEKKEKRKESELVKLGARWTPQRGRVLMNEHLKSYP